MTATAPAADVASPDGAGHLAAFLRSVGIDRTELEAFVLRQYPATARPFFVSTVVQGLAGSTSDIDIIVVAPAEDLQAAPMSTMMFHEGRRVGVKAYGDREIEAALRVAAAVNAAHDRVPATRYLAEMVADRSSLPWIDLERLVGGVGHGDNPFARHRGTIGAILAKDARHRLIDTFAAAQVAARAGQTAACLFYCSEAIAWAQAEILAAAGDLNSNPKWIATRWERARQREADTGGPVGDPIDHAYRRSIAAAAGDAPALLAEIRTIVGGLASPASDAPICSLALADGVKTGPFAHGAVYLTDSKAFAVIDEALSARLMPTLDVDRLSGAEAAAVLDLAWAGMIVFAMNGAGDRCDA